jgi:hypothetical protein
MGMLMHTQGLLREHQVLQDTDQDVTVEVQEVEDHVVAEVVEVDVIQYVQDKVKLISTRKLRMISQL